ncbi:MAG: L-2-hydroxyglutarate oxidase [Gammaproteobacteria bacterium]|nr:L-2-hydroxyglutarate oxidase [Gammaproteobacteria bacterium]
MVTDFIVIGGGVIGISVARELKRRFGDCSVTLLEKESACALHASGRNSGVLHAGFYYAADSLKAKFTRDGNRELTAYCEQRGLPINKCGKLVVARTEQELPALDELLRRGQRNGVEVEPVTAAQAQKIEPRARTIERALYSPTTSSVDPTAVVRQMEQDARAEGVRVECGVRYLGRRNERIVTSQGTYGAGYIVNAAGLYADRVALDFGFSQAYRILPFKGLYLYSDEPVGALRTHIYPVPDLRNPFLGVHFTLTVDGHVKIGPTAIPAFWREQYRGAANFSFSELADIVKRQLGLLVSSNFDFTRLAVEELGKYSRRRMAALAAELVPDLQPKNFRRWARPGIRAQLLNIRERRLEMDFVVEGDDRSLHVLNAVSPAFTCGLPFARYVADTIVQKLNRVALQSIVHTAGKERIPNTQVEQVYGRRLLTQTREKVS